MATTTNMSQGVADLARQVAIDQFAQDIDNNAKLAKKADLESPALTGTPTAPTAPSGTSTTQIASTAFVQNAVSNASNPIASGIYAAFLAFNQEKGLS